MITLRIEDLELTEAWQEADPTMRERFAFPLDTRRGATSTAVVYFEVDPGHHCGRHAHSAEEVLLILEGEAETVVGEERGRLSTGGIGLAPANVPHDLYNAGPGTLRVVGFFPSAAVITTFDEAVAPAETRLFVMGAPPEYTA